MDRTKRTDLVISAIARQELANFYLWGHLKAQFTRKRVNKQDDLAFDSSGCIQNTAHA
jgi:hypothetical protein